MNNIKKIFKDHKKQLILLSVIFAIGLVLFSVLIAITIRIDGSDDTVFQKQIMPYQTVIDWVIYRYQSWSGRIFAESFVYIFSPAPLLFWKIISIFMYAIFITITFLYYRLFDNRHSKQKDLIMLATTFILPFLMHADVILPGMFWVTGSMNYFWITTLGMVGLYPIFYYVINHKLTHWSLIVVGLISSIIAAVSQEQVGAILVGFSFILLAYELYNHKKDISLYVIYPIISTLVIFASFLFGILAPGNIVRTKLEAIKWLPDFYNATIYERIEYGYRWLLEAVVNHTGFLLLISVGLLILLFINKKNTSNIQKVYTFLLSIIFIFMIAKGYEPINQLFIFFASWNPTFVSTTSYFAMAFWAVALIVIVTAPMILFQKNIKGYLISLLYLAAIASTSVMTLSPTMYASEWRPLFVPSVIILIVSYLLISEVIDKYDKHKYLILGAVSSVAAVGYIYVILKLIHRLLS